MSKIEIGPEWNVGARPCECGRWPQPYWIVQGFSSGGQVSFGHSPSVDSARADLAVLIPKHPELTEWAIIRLTPATRVEREAIEP